MDSSLAELRLQITRRNNPMYYSMIPHLNRRSVPPPFITPPPPQNSSKHILNALNDKCMQRILSYLIIDIRDFLSASEVCKKFRENVKKCFPSIYRKFYISDHYIDHQLPLSKVNSFLSIFGPPIDGIIWESNRPNAYESEIFNNIAEFCGNTLLCLHIYGKSLDFIVYRQFKLLEELEIRRCAICNFHLPSTLRKLYLFQLFGINNSNWMSESYPNLNEVEFSHLALLNDDLVIEFQVLNPQLEIFKIDMCQNVTSSILQGISTRTPYLFDLDFHFQFKSNDELAAGMAAGQRKFERDVMHLSGSKQLRRLNGMLPHYMSMCSVLSELADNNAPIEDLEIDGLNPRIAESVGRFTNIQKLRLLYFSYEMVLGLIMKLPALQYLQILHCAHISLNGIKRILEAGTRLKVLDMNDSDLLIDSVELTNSILDLATDRVKVVIQTSPSNISIPLDRYREGYIRRYV